MSEQSSNSISIPSSEDSVSWGMRFARNALAYKLEKIVYGKITLIDPFGEQTFGALNDTCDLHAHVRVRDMNFYADILWGGSIGAAESYMRDEWSCHDLTTLMRIMVLNMKVLDEMEVGLASFTGVIQRIGHAFRRNTLRGSRKNIAEHYDLSNELFQTFLDPTMMYSSAIFESPEMSLEDASLNKLNRICQKLDLQPTDHLLEIGTGWGGFALFAAQHYGCQVTTITISKNQFELAQQRVEQAGLSDQIHVLLEDYRNMEGGSFDKLVSIEMIEAVGANYYHDYFRQCSRLLKPEGMMLIQAITIDDRQYDIARRSVDFIQRYIFPGGCLPAISTITSVMKKSTDLRLYHMEDIGPHYAETLKRWRDTFFENIETVRKLGYGDEFIRMWEYYLCYCEGGFAERSIGCMQLLFTKPLNRRQSFVPPL